MEGLIEEEEEMEQKQPEEDTEDTAVGPSATQKKKTEKQRKKEKAERIKVNSGFTEKTSVKLECCFAFNILIHFCRSCKGKLIVR